MMGKADALTRRHDFREGSKANDQEPRLFFTKGQLNISESIADIEPIEDDGPALIERIRAAQRRNEECSTRLDNAPVFPEVNKAGDSVRDGLLTHKRRIVIPDDKDSIKMDVVRSLHDGPLNGHPGQAKTLAAVARHYAWANMREYVNTFVRGCQTCVRNKPVRHKRYGKLQSLPVPGGPWKSHSKRAVSVRSS